VASHGSGLVDVIKDFEIGFWFNVYGVEWVAGACKCESNAVGVGVVNRSREREFWFQFNVAWVGLVRRIQECEFGTWLNSLGVGFWCGLVHALAAVVDEDGRDGDENGQENTESEAGDISMGPLVRCLVYVVERCWVHGEYW
jgi:hypothetical protein